MFAFNPRKAEAGINAKGEKTTKAYKMADDGLYLEAWEQTKILRQTFANY